LECTRCKPALSSSQLMYNFSFPQQNWGKDKF
jgi:hypothetical protein